jgi:hypothetical protein
LLPDLPHAHHATTPELLLRFPSPLSLHFLLCFPQIVDLRRKLFLTAFVLSIDTSAGSSKLLRLIIGCVVSGTYVALLTFARPYKRLDDLQLAALSNLLLTIIFALGIIIKVCNDGGCLALIGVASPNSAALLVILLTVFLVLVSILTIVF